MPRRPLTYDDLWSLERVAAPVPSPDGRRTAFAVTRFSREDDKGTTDLWLVPTDGGAPPRRLTWNKGSDQGPRWSPDGRWLAFLSKRGDDPAQLFRLPMDGGEAEPLTELPVAVRDFRWFPDGGRIAFAADTFPGLDADFEKVKERVKEHKEDKTQARISESRLLRYWDQYRTDGRLPHLFELDLESRAVRDLLPGFDALMGLKVFAWDLAPDGGQVAFIANSTGPPWRDLKFDLYLLDVASGEIANVTGGDGPWAGSPRYTPDGRYLLFARTHRPRNSADFTRLARYDRASGEVVELTAGGDGSAWDGEPSRWRATADGATVVFQADNRGRVSLYALPIAGGTPRVVVAGGSAGEAEVTADGRLVFVLESLTAPPEVAVVDLAGGEPEPLTGVGERLADVDMGHAEDVTFAGAGGDPVQMWVYYPPGFDPEKKWPLVMLLHGGPHSAWDDSFHYRWSTALFAARGWVMAAVNFHGSTGFGQAFAESIVGAHADQPFADVMLATDHLLAHGFVDERRVAAAGGSFGGYLAAWILGHTDRYAAVVTHAGVYDLMAQFASDYGWNREVNYGGAPWEDPAAVDRQSPSRFARHFATPTLILHGELDYRVPVTQGINLHHVLTARGVPSRIVIFPNENHWILKPQAAEVWWREVVGWLETYVGKGPSA
jgi:dipeptidyl aminopeptidase/acylaminoacyl peptidase